MAEATPRMSREQEAALVAALQGGDRKAFLPLFNEHKRRIFGLLFRMTRSRDLAEELTQDVFLKVYAEIGEFRGTARFGSWIFRIALNTGIKARERVRTVSNYAEKERVQAPAKPADPTPEAQVAEAELHRRFLEAVAGLPEDRRVAFVMRHVEGKDYPEMAEELGQPIEDLTRLVDNARDVIARRMRGPQ